MPFESPWPQQPQQQHRSHGIADDIDFEWIQSLPFSRLAGRMLAAAGSRGGQNRGEGSVLGGLGGVIGGND